MVISLVRKALVDTRPGRFIFTALRVCLGGIFIYASLDKIAEPALFAKAVYNYHLLPDALLHPVAIFLPWLELVSGITLLSNIFPKGATTLITIMLLGFTVAVIMAISRGLDISCGCFSLDADNRNISYWKVFENIGLLLMAGMIWWQAHVLTKDKSPF